MIIAIWIVGAVMTAAMYRWFICDDFDFDGDATTYLATMLVAWPLILTFIVAFVFALVFDRISSKREE